MIEKLGYIGLILLGLASLVLLYKAAQREDMRE